MQKQHVRDKMASTRIGMKDSTITIYSLRARQFYYSENDWFKRYSVRKINNNDISQYSNSRKKNSFEDNVMNEIYQYKYIY